MTTTSVTQKVTVPWSGDCDLDSWEQRARSRATGQAVLRAGFPAKTGKTEALFYSFSVEIWLCINGDEEPQLQPGGEEVRALQPLPLPIQPWHAGQVPCLHPLPRGNPEADLTFANIRGWDMPGDPGNGDSGGPGRTKEQSGVPVDHSL